MRLRVKEGVEISFETIFSILTCEVDGSCGASAEAGRALSSPAASGAGTTAEGFFAFSASSLDRRSICRSVLIFRFFF